MELLSPAGSIEALKIAANKGADAIYFGGTNFSARASAKNFSIQEIKEAIEYLKLRGVKSYITINTLYKDSEIKKAVLFAMEVWKMGADALIVQDLGLASLLKKELPQIPLHASTQMTIHNLYGAKFLEDLGFKRVVLSRETPLKEIRNILENSNIEIEVFVHGALCVSYSGLCLMSSFIGGRSGNRGRCAQACRLPYRLFNNKDEEFGQGYLLSPKDLNLLDYIDQLKELGIDSLKIEGRMKRPEYVSLITEKYRKAIDKGSKSLSKEEKADLIQIFNRGFTKGLSLGDFGRNLMSTERPDNRGIVLGEIVNLGDKLTVQLLEDLEIGDGIEYESKSGYGGFKSNVSGFKGQIIEITRPKDIMRNSKLYKTSSLSLLNKSLESQEKKREVEIIFTAIVSERAKLEILLAGSKEKVEVYGDLVEKALNKPLTLDKIQENLSKLGDTPYKAGKIEINVNEDIFIPISKLNELRRQGVKELNKVLLHNKIDIKDFKFNNIEDSKKSLRYLNVSVKNEHQILSLNPAKLDRLIVTYADGLNHYDRFKDNGVKIFYEIPTIMYQEDFDTLEDDLKNKNFDGFLCQNPGAIKFVKNRYPEKEILAGFSLNATNSYSLNFFNKFAKETSPSIELTLKEIQGLKTKDSIEVLAYGYPPLMILDYCPFSLVKGCKHNKDCESCNLGDGYLLDRKSYKFPFIRENKRTIIYNGSPILILDNLDKFVNLTDSIRLYFTMEKDFVKEIQEAHYDYIQGELDSNSLNEIITQIKRKTGATNGHYFRGVE